MSENYKKNANPFDYNGWPLLITVITFAVVAIITKIFNLL